MSNYCSTLTYIDPHDPDVEDIQCADPDPVLLLHLILMGRETRALILLLILS